MDDLDIREWLLTNGLGGFASGTVCDARTRTYHGWLIAALEPPGQRTLLLSHLEASLEIGGQIFALGTNFWIGDRVDPLGYQLLRFLALTLCRPGFGGRTNSGSCIVRLPCPMACTGDQTTVLLRHSHRF